MKPINVRNVRPAVTRNPVAFAPLSCVGSPHLTAKNTTGVFLDGVEVGAIYWMLNREPAAYSLVISKVDRGFYATEADARKAAVKLLGERWA